MSFEVDLGPREEAVADLLLEGADNAEIAKQLKMARRTVKAHMNRMFLRFNIQGGVKRVKLVRLLYRRKQWKSTAPESLPSESMKSSS